MNVLHYIYNGKTIDFSLADNNIMINATQMANAFDKRVANYLANKETQDFIKILKSFLEKQNNLPPFGGRSDANLSEMSDRSESKIIKTINGKATWMHRHLAIHFAMWLSPEFQLWIITTIDRLLLGHFRELKEATTEKLLAQQALEDKRKELLRKHPNDFAEFLAIENKLNLSNKRRQRALKESLNALQLELF